MIELHLLKSLHSMKALQLLVVLHLPVVLYLLGASRSTSSQHTCHMGREGSNECRTWYFIEV